MTSQEILSIVNDTAERHWTHFDAILIEERNGNAIIGLSGSITLNVLNEIADAIGDRFILIDSHPDGDPGIELYIDLDPLNI